MADEQETVVKPRTLVITAVAALSLVFLDKFIMEESFTCPCTDDCSQIISYSLIVILVPAILILLLGVFIQISCSAKGGCCKGAITCCKTNGAEHVQMEDSRSSSSNDGTSTSLQGAYQIQMEVSGLSSSSHGTSTSLQGAYQIQMEVSGLSSSNHASAASDSTKKSCFKCGIKLDDCCHAILYASLLALAWLSLILIDGDHVACASTCTPYAVNCTETGLGQRVFSHQFRTNRRISQYVGYVLIGITVAIFGLVNFCKCCDNCKCSCENCCKCISAKDCNKCWGCSCCCSEDCVCCVYDESLDDSKVTEGHNGAGRGQYGAINQ